MDWKEFIASVLGTLAWPAVAVTAVLLFKKQIGAAMGGRLTRLVVGPVEAEFQQGLEEAREIAEEAPRPKDEAEQQGDAEPRYPELERLSPLASTEPRAAILVAWLEVEDAIEDLIKHYTGRTVRPGRVASELRALSREHPINPSIEPLFADLRGLRNTAAHDRAFSPSAESAEQYLELCALLLDWLAEQKAGDQPAMSGNSDPASPPPAR